MIYVFDDDRVMENVLYVVDDLGMVNVFFVVDDQVKVNVLFVDDDQDFVIDGLVFGDLLVYHHFDGRR